MTELTIDRLTASAVTSSDAQVATESRIATLLRRIAASRLDSALAEVSLPQGHWCVRRLDLSLTLDFDRSDAALEAQWSRALVDAIAAAITNRSCDLVFYPRIVDALIDLLISAIRHCDGNEWAWRQVGLLSSTDRGVCAAGADRARMVLAALRRHPRDTIAAVAACVRVTGGASLHRMLGAAGWTELALIALGALGCSTRVGLSTMAIPGSPTSPTVVTSPPPAHQSRFDDPTGSHVAGAAAALAGDVFSRSAVAAALARMSIRVERPLARAWAVIAIAEAAPSILLRADADAVIDLLAERFIRPADRAAMSFLAAARSVGARGSEDAAARGRSGTEESVRAPASEVGATGTAPQTTTADTTESSGDDADRDPPAQTLWAGVLFFLNTAAAAGIPEDTFADPVLGRYPLWCILSALVRSMVPISADDPALLAVCGLPRHPVAAPFTDDEQTRVETFASRWIARTAERMDLIDEDPADVCLRVALRSGSIVAEPGWIEVHLDLDDVDIDVRRAGLDLDPGWIPWLGCVVRFCYE
jgi:hypothetical protein